MQSVKKSPFLKFIVWVITAAFCLNGSGVAFGTNNLKPRAAAKDELPDIGDELIRTHNLRDGGVALDIAHVVHFKEWLGANAILGGSAAGVRLAAAAYRMPLWQYMAEVLGNVPGRGNFTYEQYLEAIQTIYPELNIMNGGAHASWVTDIQEFMIMVGLYTRMPYWKRMDMAKAVVIALTEIYQSPTLLKEVLGREILKPFPTTVGDEGGYAPAELKGNEEAFKLVAAAIKRAGLEEYVQMVIDGATSGFYNEKSGEYELKSEKRTLSRTEWIAQLKVWFDEYKVVACEDTLAENDHEGWRQGFKVVGNTMIVVGDDLTVTNLEFLKQAIAENAEQINSILIKINQNGSISGTIEVIQYALLHGINVAISHRSGETEDDFIAALTLASNMFRKAPHPKTGRMPVVILKTGGMTRSDRLAKQNFLLNIETEIERQITRGMGSERPEPTMELSKERIIADLSPTTIIDMWASEIRDSRGNPTVEVFIKLNNGLVLSNKVPSGASTGERESRELRDGTIVETQPFRITRELVDWIFKGKITDLAAARRILFERGLSHDKKGNIKAGNGVSIAVANVNYLIAPRIIAAHIDVAKLDSLQALQHNLDQVMFDLELELAKQDAQKVKVNVMGATGEMGPQMVNRLSLDPEKVTVIASARKKDEASYRENLANGIIDNPVAVAQSKVIIPAVNVKGLKSAISDNVKYMQKGAIIFSIASPWERIEGKPVYRPPQGYQSAAQMIKALAPEQDVVVGWQSVPAEWARDTEFSLSHMQLVLLGKKEACELIRDSVIKTMCKADVVIIEDSELKMAWALEKLTPVIIDSKKELIVGGGLTLAELTRFIYERGPEVTTEEVVDFNRKTLDASLRKRYADSVTFNAEVKAMNDRTKSSAHKEHLRIGLKRYAELSDTEEAKKQAIQDAFARFKIESAGTKLTVKMPGKFENVVKAIEELKGQKLVAAIDADSILKYPGALANLQALRSKKAQDVNIIVSVSGSDQERKDKIRQLEVMGVGEIATIDQRDLSEIKEELQIQGATPGVVVGLIAEEEKVDALGDTQGLLVYRLQAPKEQKEGAVYIAPWKFIFTDLIAKAYDSEKVKDVAAELRESYGEKESGMMSNEALAKFNLLTTVFDVPLVPVTDEDMKKQINTYTETVKSI